MSNYLEILESCLNDGVRKPSRPGIDTRSIFGVQYRHNLYNGRFPLLTTKKVHFKSVVHELLWFISGSTDIRYLQDNGVTIWDEWANSLGCVGPIYGHQWRSWLSYNHRYPGGSLGNDQLVAVIESIKDNPHSRRHIVSAWNVGDLDRMALPPCHLLYQFYVSNGHLSCHMFQRSADVFLGLPFNIASYALLTHMVARVCGLDVGELVISITDCHLYENHVEQAKEQLSRKPKRFPTLLLAERDSIDDFVYDDIQIKDYHHHPAIKAEVAV